MVTTSLVCVGKEGTGGSSRAGRNKNTAIDKKK